jgi:transcriptional regulator with XRE-family HTH domain
VDIGYKLYELRKNAGFDAGTFADMVGISRSYVHKLEKNQSVPTVSILQRWVVCTRPEGSDLNNGKMERWLELSLSFLFEDGFLGESQETDVKSVAEQELVVSKMPTFITLFLPTHYLHQLYIKLTKRG